MGTKICRACLEEKCIGDFYKHKEMADGHLNICKDCTKDRVTKHRDANIERIRAYDRGRPRRSHTTKKYTERHPKKRAVHCRVSNAIRDGRMAKVNKCECCGKSDCRVVAHHDDYEQPFEVSWLCTVCHCAWHKEHGAGING